MTLTTLKPVRSDTLPENTKYIDDGCEVAPACLECPLPICKYDDPGWIQRENRKVRDEEIFRLRKNGIPIRDLARQFGVSTRTVHRVIQRGGPSPDHPHDEDEGPILTLEELALKSIFRRRTPLPRIPENYAQAS